MISSASTNAENDTGEGTEAEEDESEQFLNDLRAASGIGRIRRSSKGRRKGKGKARICTQFFPNRRLL